MESTAKKRKAGRAIGYWYDTMDPFLSITVLFQQPEIFLSHIENIHYKIHIYARLFI